MTYLWPTLAFGLVLLASCHARAASPDASDFMKMLETKEELDSSNPMSQTNSGYRLGQSAGDFSLPLDSHSEPSLSSSSSSSSSSSLGENRHGLWAIPAFQEDDDENDVSNFRKTLEEDHLLRLKGEIMRLRKRLLATAGDYPEEGLEKRYKPSGFMGSRGKRFIPGLESLLLAKYYEDAEKWKRQPHLGFHGSRG